MFQEGDIVEIPMPDGRTAIGWILHVSQHFQGAVGFIVFGMKGQLRDDVVMEYESEKPSSMTVLGPLYTHIDAIKHYRWKVVGHQPILESKLALTKRVVGGGVYVPDEYLGSVDELQETGLRPMLAMGMPVVYSEIEKAFGKAASTSD